MYFKKINSRLYKSSWPGCLFFSAFYLRNTRKIFLTYLYKIMFKKRFTKDYFMFDLYLIEILLLPVFNSNLCTDTIFCTVRLCVLLVFWNNKAWFFFMTHFLWQINDIFRYDFKTYNPVSWSWIQLTIQIVREKE